MLFQLTDCFLKISKTLKESSCDILPGADFKKTNRSDNGGENKNLVVDDDGTVCNTFARGLEKFGYWVDTVHNVDKALDKLTWFNPYLILLDIRMPLIFVGVIF